MIFATIDNGVYDKYLGKCGLDPIILPPGSPAKSYNKVLRENEGYICFVHSDVTCKGLLEAIEETIVDRPNHVIGAVGNGGRWAQKRRLFDITTCDSCCIVVNTEWGLFFDEDTFCEFHLYVEDFCMQALKNGIKCSTMYLDGYEGMVRGNTDRYFVHHSHTLNQRGCNWGSYNEYKQKLNKKWNRLVPTT